MRSISLSKSRIQSISYCQTLSATRIRADDTHTYTFIPTFFKFSVIIIIFMRVNDSYTRFYWNGVLWQLQGVQSIAIIRVNQKKNNRFWKKQKRNSALKSWIQFFCWWKQNVRKNHIYSNFHLIEWISVSMSSPVK